MSRFIGVLAVAVVGFTALAPEADADVSVGVAIGPEPVCPYGYYDYDPYVCAPYGYYGPEWFISGIFVGAGPWFHGPEHFRGHVDNRFDMRHGFRGPFPHRGERPEPSHRLDRMDGFHGDEMRDGRGFGDGARGNDMRDGHGEMRDGHGYSHRGRN